MRLLSGFCAWCLLLVLALAAAHPSFAQELEPRRWGHLPIGTNFAGVAYTYTEAEIFADPVVLLEDVDMELHTWAAKYIRTFELFEKSARIDFVQAYQDGNWNGLLDGVPASTSRSGWSDSILRFAVNLHGAPPLAGWAIL